MTALTHGQLFMLRMTKNRQARQLALSTMHECRNGWWLVVVGGMQRGTVLTLPSRSAAVAAVTKFYNQRLHETVSAFYAKHTKTSTSPVAR